MAFEERGKQLFSTGVQFERGVCSETDFPKLRLPEIAFAGRSNVGKSSLINALTGKQIARASNTPGRTQELNFFKIGTRFFLVDLPGYGFASAPRDVVKAWTQLIHAYLRGRQQLKRVFLLIDARHGLKKVDQDIMIMLDRAAVTYQIVLTKADKVKNIDLEKILMKTMEEGKKHVACFPEMLVTSSENGLNVAALRGEIYKIVEGL